MNQEYKQPKEMPLEDINFKKPSFLADFSGSFETISSVPIITPTTAVNQIKFYSNAGTYRLYIYDMKNNIWRYTTLT